MTLLTLLIPAAVAGVVTLIAVGSNDVANSQATAVGSGALKLRSAYILAGICEFLGSSLMGSNVSSTLGDNFISHSSITDYDYSWGMFLSLVSAGMWILICTYLQMPASSTHAIVGALIGFELIATNWNSKNLDWSIVWSMVVAWLITPLMSLILSYSFMIALSYYWPMKTLLKTNPRLHSSEMFENEQQELELEQQSEIMMTDMNDDNNKNKHVKNENRGKSPLLGASNTTDNSNENHDKNANDPEIDLDHDAKEKEKEREKKSCTVSDGEDDYDSSDDSLENNTRQGNKHKTKHKKSNINDLDENPKFLNESEIELSMPLSKPEALKFGLLFGIVITVIVLFIVVGGPPQVRIYNKVPAWSLFMLSIFVLMMACAIGYQLEKPYRNYYTRNVLNKIHKDDDIGNTNNNIINTDSIDNLITTNPNLTESQLHIQSAVLNQDRSSSTSGYDMSRIIRVSSYVDRSTNIDDNNDDSKKNNNNNSSVHRVFESQKRKKEFVTEDYFVLFLIIASGAVSFAHGGNDVANVIGPFGEIYVYYKYNNLEKESFIVPIWLSMMAGTCIVIGFVLFGKSVLSTVGNKITKLTYRSGFAAQFAAALTVLLCNVLGIPVSSTTVIVGAVAGVGFYHNREYKHARARETGASGDGNDNDNYNDNDNDEIVSANGSDNDVVMEIGPSTTGLTRFLKKVDMCVKKVQKMDLKIIGKILLTWFVTIPANAIICAICYSVFKSA